MRFMKGGKGFLPVEKIHKVSVEEYRIVRKEWFESIRSRTWYVPKSKNFERLLVMGFSRSSKWLSRPVQRFTTGRKKLSVYRFTCTCVVAEWIPGKNLIAIRIQNIGRRLKFSMVAGLMALHLPLKRVIEKYIFTGETLHVLSQLWYEYVCGDEQGTFGFWVMRQSEMKRLLQYREMHTTREYLWAIA